LLALHRAEVLELDALGNIEHLTKTIRCQTMNHK